MYRENEYTNEIKGTVIVAFLGLFQQIKGIIVDFYGHKVLLT